MSKAALAGIGVAVLVTAGVAAQSASADIQFQPDPCVITLEPSYVDAGQPIAVPLSAVTCPPQFTSFDPAVNGVNVWFATDSGAGSAQLYSWDRQAYDPAANAIVTTRLFRLTGTSGTYTQVDTSAERGYLNGMYIEDNTTTPSTYYRLQLARPFTIIGGAPATPTCTLTMAPKYTYVWGQGEGNQYLVPDSAISCTGGVTYNSRDFTITGSFDSRYADQAWLEVQYRPVFNPATRTSTPVHQLWLVPLIDSPRNGFGPTFNPAERQEMGQAPGGRGSAAPFGRFTANPTGLTVKPNAGGSNSPGYALTLVAPFTIKRRTDVGVTAKRAGRGRLTLDISADRNASFQNTTAPSYRRQSVLPDTRADHAVVRRGSTVLARVKLTPYGKGSVTVKDPRGRNAYSVTMVATDANYAGVARITR